MLNFKETIYPTKNIFLNEGNINNRNLDSFAVIVQSTAHKVVQNCADIINHFTNTRGRDSSIYFNNPLNPNLYPMLFDASGYTPHQMTFECNIQMNEHSNGFYTPMDVKREILESTGLNVIFIQKPQEYPKYNHTLYFEEYVDNDDYFEVICILPMTGLQRTRINKNNFNGVKSSDLDAVILAWRGNHSKEWTKTINGSMYCVMLKDYEGYIRFDDVPYAHNSL